MILMIDKMNGDGQNNLDNTQKQSITAKSGLTHEA